MDHRTRTVNFEKAMEVRQGPTDSEIAAFYALSVNQTMVPTDKTYAQQLKAAAISRISTRRCRIIPGWRTT